MQSPLAILLGLGLFFTVAQESSPINAIGYVNTGLQPGFNLISNPLDRNGRADENTLTNLLNGVGVDATVYLLGQNGFESVEFDAASGTFSPQDAAGTVILPGDGFFVQVHGTAPTTITFAGQMAQGVLTNHLPRGLSFQSSIVPQEGFLTANLGFQPVPGDQVYRFNARAQRFETHTFDDLFGWDPAEPRLMVGEAFLLRTNLERDWVRTFFLNP